MPIAGKWRYAPNQGRVPRSAQSTDEVIRLSAATPSAVRQARAIARVWAAAVICWTGLAAAACTAVVIGAPFQVAVPISAAVALLWAAPLVRFSWIRPPVSPTVALPPGGFGELLLAVRQVTAALDVDEPHGIEISPDCDAWLDPRQEGPVLVVGAPFLWWLRVSELRGWTRRTTGSCATRAAWSGASTWLRCTAVGRGRAARCGRSPRRVGAARS
jgi:hypothetical protein